MTLRFAIENGEVMEMTTVYQEDHLSITTVNSVEDNEIATTNQQEKTSFKRAHSIRTEKGCNLGNRSRVPSEWG